MEEQSEIGLWIGMDWADQKHQFCLQQSGSSRIEEGEIAQKPEALQEWMNRLRERAGGCWVAIAVEQSRGALIYALMDYDFVLIYPINPKSLARYREVFYPSGGKDDPRDADLALDYLLKHRDRLHLWKPESPEIRCLRLLTEERRKLVDLRTELTNQLTANLKTYYPQALQWAGRLKEDTACDFLERWPSLAELQQAGTGPIRRFFKSHGARRRNLEEQLAQIANAVALTRDPAVSTAGGMLTVSLVQQIRPLNRSIERFDRKIAELFKNHPDHFIFTGLPGSGPALGPRLLTLFGDDRERFDSAEQVQIVTGIAPLIESSGKKTKKSPGVVHFRWACPKFVRQSMHEFAVHSLKRCVWARAYYEMQLSRGKTHHMAARALAYKWLRVLFVCWRDGVAYDEGRYMESLKANNSPLLAFL
jgi:transposase